MKAARPWGVTVMAILTVISGALTALAGLATLGGASILGGLGGASLGLTGIYVSLAIFALSAATLYFAWAIWRLKSWAWVVLIISSGIAIIATLVGSMSSRSAANFAGLAVNLLVAYYLFRPEVKAAFGR